MKELLLKYGYFYEGSCHCDGHLTDKYLKGDIQVRIRKRTSYFKVRKSGRSVTQWIPAAKLEETIKNLELNVAV